MPPKRPVRGSSSSHSKRGGSGKQPKHQTPTGGRGHGASGSAGSAGLPSAPRPAPTLPPPPTPPPPPPPPPPPTPASAPSLPPLPNIPGPPRESAALPSPGHTHGARARAAPSGASSAPLPLSCKDAPEEQKPAIRKKQNLASAKRSREKKAREEAALQGKVKAHGERLAQLSRRVEELTSEIESLPPPSQAGHAGSPGAGSSRLAEGSSTQGHLPPRPPRSGVVPLPPQLPNPQSSSRNPSNQRHRGGPSSRGNYWDIELPDELKEDNTEDEPRGGRGHGRGRR